MEAKVVAAFVVRVRLTNPEMCRQDWNTETLGLPGPLGSPQVMSRRDWEPALGSYWPLPSLGILQGPERASLLPQSLLDLLSPALTQQQP